MSTEGQGDLRERIELAVTLLQQRRYEEALPLLDAALELAPRAAIPWTHRGLALQGMRRFEDSVDSYDRALSLGLDDAQLRLNRGNALGELLRFDEALRDFDRALELQPGFAGARRNRGIMKLLLGDYAGGLADYEHRRPQDPARRQRTGSDAPDWRGEGLAGRSLLVTDATGMGDEIHMLRYLPLLAASGARISFLGNAKLYRLFAPMADRVRFLAAPPTGERFDFQCKLLSLPYLCGTTPATIPAQVPYLRAEPALVERWRARLGSHGFRVGIGWKGNPTRSIDAGRSIPLAGFRDIAALPGVRLVSLQKRFGLEELDGLPDGMRVEVLGDFDDGPDAFIDTAAVMANMDLVISSCTSLPHLAGALARPTWLAAKLVPEWRWGIDGEENRWYPTMRIFRQPRRDDWAPVFAAMTEALRALMNEKRRR